MYRTGSNARRDDRKTKHFSGDKDTLNRIHAQSYHHPAVVVPFDELISSQFDLHHVNFSRAKRLPTWL